LYVVNAQQRILMVKSPVLNIKKTILNLSADIVATYPSGSDLELHISEIPVIAKLETTKLLNVQEKVNVDWLFPIQMAE